MTDVVIGIGVVHVNAKQDVDALTLVLLEDVLHAHVKPGREEHASHQKQDAPTRGSLSETRQRGCPDQQKHQRPQHRQGNQEPPKARVHAHKRVPTFTCTKQNGQHRKHQSRHPQKEHVAAESFAVKDKDKPSKHKHRSGIGLKQNEARRNGDDCQGLQPSFERAPGTSISAEVPGDHEGGGRFGKFTRLDPKAPHPKPRPRAAHLLSDDQHSGQQRQDHEVMQHGSPNVKFPFHSQEPRHQHGAYTHPNELFPGFAAQVPNDLSLGRGAHNVQPTERDQGDDKHQGGPIKLRQNGGATRLHHGAGDSTNSGSSG